MKCQCWNLEEGKRKKKKDKQEMENVPLNRSDCVFTWFKISLPSCSRSSLCIFLGCFFFALSFGMFVCVVLFLFFVLV